MAERETEDRRVRKTKKQLRGALTSLLLEKDISRVTVRDVADLADVNRGTFYAHYSDVYDLLHQLEDDLLRRLDDVGSRHNARQSDGKTFRYLTDLFHSRASIRTFSTRFTAAAEIPNFRTRYSTSSSTSTFMSFCPSSAGASPKSWTTAPRSSWPACARSPRCGSKTACAKRRRKWRVSAARS